VFDEAVIPPHPTPCSNEYRYPQILEGIFTRTTRQLPHIINPWSQLTPAIPNPKIPFASVARPL
jgi:hypothetical protein